MRKSILMAMIVGCICLLSGCGDSWDQAQVAEMNKLQKPIIIVSNDIKGGVLVRGSEGKLYLAKYDTYLGIALKNMKPGDVIVPTR